MIVKEHFLSVNKFNEPVVYEGNDAIYVLLIRLMIMNPGTSEINPEMGVGIVKNWRYCDFDQIPELKLCIEKQIATYLPQLQAVEVNITPSTEKVGEILIDIQINTVLYTFKTDWANNTLDLNINEEE